jgi:hypothetical protein
VSSDGNRYLLARIPIVDSDGTYTLAKEDAQNGKKRTAAQLRGNDQGNDLTEALRGDEHLESFLAIPGKAFLQRFGLASLQELTATMHFASS